jgi:hypothetical protein
MPPGPLSWYFSEGTLGPSPHISLELAASLWLQWSSLQDLLAELSQGQMMQAVLDTAVNTFSMGTIEEKAVIFNIKDELAVVISRTANGHVRSIPCFLTIRMLFWASLEDT